MVMHRELEYSPKTLTCRDIPRISEIGNLVDVLLLLGILVVSIQAYPGSVMALVHILVEILHCAYSGAHLNINVSIVFCRQPWIVRNNPAIVDWNILISSRDSMPLILLAHTSAVDRVAFAICVGHIYELARIFFGTVAINHARGMGLVTSAWSMNH